MKAIKNLDVQDIQQQVDSTKKFINKTKEGVEQVKQAINGITTLNDKFKGQNRRSEKEENVNLPTSFPAFKGLPTVNREAIVYSPREASESARVCKSPKK
ncbi:T7SS effector LXG polymorphic toxin [Terribacillus aidingensis]|uniref:T7SS effector LXG polymorphic toxin n=1 Tax=Terribacillus aidingensis TaxID=586416 RepID=UPI0015CDB1ED|nr:T7SS effector LXG polymorphic toxin [Terribacillus aidingensis]